MRLTFLSQRAGWDGWVGCEEDWVDGNKLMERSAVCKSGLSDRGARPSGRAPLTRGRGGARDRG